MVFSVLYESSLMNELDSQNELKLVLRVEILPQVCNLFVMHG